MTDRMRRWMPFVPGVIWGSWLLLLSGFAGRVPAPSVSRGLDVTILTSIGGLALLGVVVLVGRGTARPTATVVRHYGAVGLLELAQSLCFLQGVLQLLDGASALIPLVRMHTGYLIILVGAVAGRLGVARPEPVTRRKVLCIVATASGLGLVGLQHPPGSLDAATLRGLQWLLASVAVSSVQHFAQQRLCVSAGPGHEVAGTTVQLAVTVTAGLAIAAVSGGAFPRDAYTWAYLVSAGVLTSGVAFYLRFRAYVAHGMTALETAVRQEIEYGLQLLSAVFVLGDRLTAGGWLGVLLIFAASYFVRADGGGEG